MCVFGLYECVEMYVIPKLKGLLFGKKVLFLLTTMSNGLYDAHASVK